MTADKTENTDPEGEKPWTGKDFTQMLREVFGDRVMELDTERDELSNRRILRVEFFKFRKSDS